MPHLLEMLLQNPVDKNMRSYDPRPSVPLQVKIFQNISDKAIAKIRSAGKRIPEPRFYPLASIHGKFHQSHDLYRQNFWHQKQKWLNQSY